ncbi:MAG: hypothetical protein FJZ01_24425 [Candidatus Sericytochromatia bacterium]|nr:hypothetical protein [Candidatus Tanganyikabacteria bacterium]
MGGYQGFDLGEYRNMSAGERAEYFRKLKAQHERQAAGQGAQVDSFKVLLGRFVGIEPGQVADYSMGKLLDLAYTRMLAKGAFTPAEEGMLKDAGFAERLRTLAEAASPLSDEKRPDDPARLAKDRCAPGLDGTGRLKASLQSK